MTATDHTLQLQMKATAFHNLLALTEDKLDDDVRAWVAARALTHWDALSAALAALTPAVDRLKALAADHHDFLLPGTATSTDSVAVPAEPDAGATGSATSESEPGAEEGAVSEPGGPAIPPAAHPAPPVVLA